MATSGSTNYSLTAREVINFALRKTNLLALGQAADNDMVDAALVELNVMCKEWMKYPAIWRLSEASLTPTANTASISMSSANPYRVVDCRFRNTSSRDTPMEEMTRQEYYAMPIKTSTGTPTTWYFDPQRATNTLYIWPVLASVTTETIQATYQRRFEDVDDLTNEVDITQEHLSTVGYNLAARLADNFGRSGGHIDRIIQRAVALAEEMKDADRPEVIRFVPEARY
jgi:hypothetical protein